MDFLTLYYMTKAKSSENLTEKLGSLTVAPSTISKTYSKTDLPNYTTELYTGINTVTVEGVTSNIDSDIQPENIREGKTILGVTGNIVPLEGELADKMSNYNALTNAFRQATTAPSLLTGGYNLDKDESDEDILVKLPYLYTPNIKYSESTPISNSVIECGFDVSASGDTISHTNEKSMFNQPNRSRNLKKLKLTGFERIAYGTAIFSNVYGSLSNLVELTIVEGNNYREEYNANYYQAFFFKCRNLEAIKGTPLDMSRGTTYYFMFKDCAALKYVRFKPGTICYNLDFATCPYIIKGEYGNNDDNPGTIISILNGIRDYVDVETTPSFKISFKSTIKSYFTNWKVIYNEESALWEFSEDLGAITLASAFSGTKDSDVSIPYGKGVELAWTT